MKTVGFIGGGNMGSAILSRIRKSFNIVVCEADAAKAKDLKKKYKIALSDLTGTVKASDIIIIAVKPQMIDEVLEQMRAAKAAKKLVISIAAGITISYIEGKLGAGARVIRTMPNLPATIGEGMTGIAQGANATKADLSQAEKIFEAVGKTVIVKEDLIDVITAVSGSGPAYVFLFVECMMNAARSMGLDEEMSRELVYQTLRGGAQLLEKSDDDAATLRAKVTSKGGTTQAAMDVFFSRGIDKIFDDALTAARDRARELAK